MKFTKPISRELDIDGNTFIVSFDDRGIEFRVKSKRKTAHVAWNKVLEIAQGEDGSNASQFLGIGQGNAQSEPERQEQAAAPQTLRDDQFQQTGSHQSPDSLVAEPQSNEQSSNPDTPGEVGRAVTAGEKGPES